MHRFCYKEIKNSPLSIKLLEVLSFEMNIYLVRLTILEGSGLQHGLVYDMENDKPMRFSTTIEIKEFFQSCIVESAVMVHDSPYDEMINNPPKQAQQTALPFSMTLPF